MVCRFFSKEEATPSGHEPDYTDAVRVIRSHPRHPRLHRLARGAILSQALSRCEQGELYTIRDEQLVENACHVVLHGEMADAQAFGDFAISHALNHTLHNLEFPS